MKSVEGGTCSEEENLCQTEGLRPHKGQGIFISIDIVILIKARDVCRFNSHRSKRAA